MANGYVQMSETLQQRFDQDIWTTLDGEALHISKMTDTHLINTLNMINRKGADCAYGFGGEWFPKLKQERIRRQHADRLRKGKECKSL